MQCLLPHEASTTWAGGTEPWASIQLRRRRPKAVDRLAISSQSPFRVVGENSPIAILLDSTSQVGLGVSLAGIVSRCHQQADSGAILAVPRFTYDGMSESGLWHLHAKVISQSRLPLRFGFQ